MVVSLQPCFVFVFGGYGLNRTMSELMEAVLFSSVTQSPAASSSVQNGPTSTSDLHNMHVHDSSDNDDDSGPDGDALQKEISRLREK